MPGISSGPRRRPRQSPLDPETINALKDMAKEMAQAMIEDLARRGALGSTTIINQNGPRIPQDQRSGVPEGIGPSIEIDASVADVGVSTYGLGKGSQEPLANSSTQEDKGLESSKAKLRELKKGH